MRALVDLGRELGRVGEAEQREGHERLLRGRGDLRVGGAPGRVEGAHQAEVRRVGDQADLGVGEERLGEADEGVGGHLPALDDGAAAVEETRRAVEAGDVDHLEAVERGAVLLDQIDR